MNWRKNVMMLAFMVFVMTIVVDLILWAMDAEVGVIVGATGAGVSILGMLAKELLTDAPPPMVPASIVEKILDQQR